jgi:hypothetical protein
MAAPKVALVVDRLERRLRHSPAFLEQHGEQYRQTLSEIRSHLQPKLSGSMPASNAGKPPAS